MSKIILDTKNTENPIGVKVLVCSCCHKEAGLLLMGKYQQRLEDPRSITVMDGSICTECEEILKDGGVWLREITNPPPSDNVSRVYTPMYTGNGIRLRKQAAVNLLDSESYEQAVKNKGIVCCCSEVIETISKIVQ
jgi:hypothetical protein